MGRCDWGFAKKSFSSTNLEAIYNSEANLRIERDLERKMTYNGRSARIFSTILVTSAILSTIFSASPAIAEDMPSTTSPAAEAAPVEKPADGDATQPKAESTEQKDPKRPYSADAIQHYNRAHDLHQQGFFNQAIAEYRAALAADDRMEEAYTNLGLIYAAQRNYTKAMEAFKKALALRPTRPNALNGLATVLYAKNRFAEALENWKKAVELDPHFASAYYNMGNALENEKDIQGAIESYVKAMSINPQMADAYYRIGSIYAREKHPAQATLLLSKAVQLDPSAEFVHEAQKAISSMEGDLKSGGNEAPEVKMNVIGPASDSGGEQHPSTSLQ